MIETYSNNITVAPNSAIPLNTVFKKGCTVEKSGDATIQMNKCGIYEVSVNATGIAQDGGLITLQLMVNGVSVPYAYASETASDTTSTHSLGFTTKVQVPVNFNEYCACSPAFLVTLMNTGVETTYSLVNVIVTKIV